MANTVPVSFSPARSGSKTEGAPNPVELMIEHQKTSEQSDLPESSVRNTGGDAGTKGTGSAG